MTVDWTKRRWFIIVLLAGAGCTQAARSGAAELCGEMPVCFRAEGMITPTGATDAPGPYTVVADVVSDQAIGWVRVAFRRTRQGEVQSQEEFRLERTESGLYIGTLDGRSGDVLNYRLDTAQAGSTDLVFWPGPDADQMLSLRLLMPGEVLDAGLPGGGHDGGDGGLRDGGVEDGGPGDGSVGPNDGGPPDIDDAGLVDAG